MAGHQSTADLPELSPEEVALTPCVNINESNDIAPPSYIESQTALPSYDQLLAKPKHHKCQTCADQMAAVVLGTVGCSLCISMVLLLPVSMIVLGIKYLRQCPVEPYLPIYLLVLGIFAIIKNLLNIAQRLKNQDSNGLPNRRTVLYMTDSTVNCFIIGWFIAGNVWVYYTFGRWSSFEDQDNYCKPFLYWLAFSITTSVYIVIGFTCIVTCTAGVVRSVMYPSKAAEKEKQLFLESI